MDARSRSLSRSLDELDLRDGARVLRRREHAGDLGEGGVPLLAFLGYPPARLLTGRIPNLPTAWQDAQRLPFSNWGTEFFSRWPSLGVHAAVAAIRAASGHWEKDFDRVLAEAAAEFVGTTHQNAEAARHRGILREQLKFSLRTVEACEAWLAHPCEDHRLDVVYGLDHCRPRSVFQVAWAFQTGFQTHNESMRAAVVYAAREASELEVREAIQDSLKEHVLSG